MLKFVKSFLMLITVVYLYSDNNNIKTKTMTTTTLKNRLQELNVNAFRITNRLGKIILTISWKDYQFLTDTDIDNCSGISINMI